MFGDIYGISMIIFASITFIVIGVNKIYNCISCSECKRTEHYDPLLN